MNTTVCRICCEVPGVVNIFDGGGGSEIPVCVKLTHCISKLSVLKGDGLPETICNNCNADLASSYNFILRCEDSDRKLHSVNFVKSILNPNYEDCKPKLEVKDENLESTYNGLGDSQDNSDIFTLHNLKHTLKIKVEECVDVKERAKRPYKKRTKNRNSSGPYTCSVCGRICINHSALLVHMRSHTNEKPYECGSCDKKYKDSGSLKRHIERNHFKENRERNFICEHCGKGFFSKYYITIHMRSHTGETPYACPVCPSRFSQVSGLWRHKKCHTGEKTHQCTTCSKCFSTKDQLKAHYNVHTTEKKFSCNICDVKFKYQNNLKKHIRLHSERNNFVCNYCGKKFSMKGNLKLHISRQHSEKSGYCSLCCKNVPDMAVHMWRHTGQRPLKCELCASSFYDLKALAHHVNFRHKNIDKFHCSVEGCNLKFPSKPMLNFHTAKVHGTEIPFPCDRCSRGFYRKNDLARHKIGTHKERLV